jgi:hypothetical protein
MTERYGFTDMRLPSYTGSGAQTFPVTDLASGFIPDYSSPNLFGGMSNYGTGNSAFSFSGGQMAPNTSGLGLKVFGTPEQFGWKGPNTGGGSGGVGNWVNNYGGLALGALQGVGNLFMGMKQYNMAKDALRESKRQFNVNYDAQRKLTNSRLEDRQRARIAADPNAHQSVDDYMNRYGVR